MQDGATEGLREEVCYREALHPKNNSSIINKQRCAEVAYGGIDNSHSL